jgi:hypothetical protein
MIKTLLFETNLFNHTPYRIGKWPKLKLSRNNNFSLNIKNVDFTYY